MRLSGKLAERCRRTLAALEQGDISRADRAAMRPLELNICLKHEGQFDYRIDDFARFSPQKKRLLRERRLSNAARPKFVRFAARRTKRLGRVWRRPRGSQNKQRKMWAGRPAMPNVGHRNPGKVRGLNARGYREILVHSRGQLQLLISREVARDVHVKMAGTMGLKLRVALENRACAAGFYVCNPVKLQVQSSG